MHWALGKSSNTTIECPRLAPLYTLVLVASPHDLRAEWELWFAVASLHHRRGLDPIMLGTPKSKFNIQSMASTEYVLLLHHGQVEKSQVEHCKSENLYTMI